MVQKWAEELHQKCLLRDPYREFNKNIPFTIKAKINGQQPFHTTFHNNEKKSVNFVSAEPEKSDIISTSCMINVSK